MPHFYIGSLVRERAKLDMTHIKHLISARGERFLVQYTHTEFSITKFCNELLIRTSHIQQIGTESY